MSKGDDASGKTAKKGKRGKASEARGASKDETRISNKEYERELKRLHVELVRLQEWVKEKGLKVCVVFEGRDGAGKGGTIKAITERVSPRVFRVVALPAPTDREKSQMYIQRYMAHFPAAGEVVIFDRSWYPGWRAEDIADALPTSGLSVTKADFMDQVLHPPAEILPAGFPAVESLEGYLFPGTYQINRNVTASELVSTLISRFQESFTQDMRDGFSSQGLDIDQAVRLASIVEREAVIADEKPMIASVFYNRLAAGMRLESDPTVQYAQGYQLFKKTWWKNPLTLNDLRVDSHYNTYAYPGLPPGPISNPGLDTLRAVAFPAQTGYFYFRGG